MKATLYSVRIAPKKAQLVAKMVRNMPVMAAIEVLEHTNKKAARIIEGVLKSAVANARTNDKQSPAALTITSLTINKAEAYRRGVPMARGRVRPMRKFLSHIAVTLGVDTNVKAPKATPASKKNAQSTSQTDSAPVKKSSTTSASSKSASTSPKKSAGKKSDTTASNSGSARKKSTKSAS